MFTLICIRENSTDFRVILFFLTRAFSSSILLFPTLHKSITPLLHFSYQHGCLLHLFVHLVMRVELWLNVTQLTSTGYYEPPLMSVELWQSHDEFQPVPAVVLPTVHSVFPEHVFEIPELTKLSLAVPVLMIQQPATLHSPAADSVTHRILN